MDDKTRRQSNRKLAQRYATHGFAVFLAEPEHKQPFHKAWQRLDTEIPPDEKRQILADYHELHDRPPFCLGSTQKPHLLDQLFAKRPDALPALNVGHNDLVIVDADKKHGIDGPSLTAAFFKANGVDVSACPLIDTQGGGVHYAFRHATVGCAKIQRLNVDIKGRGGYIIAPGSIRPDGRTYTPRAGHPDLIEALEADVIPELPQCILDAMVKCAAPQTDNDAEIQASIRRLETMERPDLDGFDLDALTAKDPRFRDAIENPNPDTSTQRFTLARIALAEYGPERFTDLHLAALYEHYDGCGEYVTGRTEQGEYNSRHIAREYHRARGSERMSDGSAFEAADLDTSETNDDYGMATNPNVARTRLVAEDYADLVDGDDEPVSFLIDDLIELGVQFVLYGDPGSGKSAVMLDMMLHIAHGLPWAGRATKKVGVLYISPEGPKGGRRRVRAWRARMLRTHPDLGTAPFRMVRQQVDLFNNDADTVEILKLIKTFHAECGVPCGLVVVDTMRKSMPGGDENSAKDIGVVTAKIQHIIEKTGATGGLVHHGSKDKARGASGSTAIPGNVDIVLKAEKKSKSDRHGVITSDKTRDGWLADPLTYDLVEEHSGHKEDGTPLSAVVAVMRQGRVGETDGSAMGPVDIGDDDPLADDPLFDEPTVPAAQSSRPDKGNDRLKAAAADKLAAREALVEILMGGKVKAIPYGTFSGCYRAEDVAAHHEPIKALFDGAGTNFAREFRKRYLSGDGISGETSKGRLLFETARKQGSIIRFVRNRNG